MATLSEKWSAQRQTTKIDSGTTFCCLNDLNENIIIPTSGMTSISLPGVTGVTIGGLIDINTSKQDSIGLNATPTATNQFKVGNVTGMTVGNLISVTPTNVNFNGGNSMIITDTTMSVSNNNLVRIEPNKIDLNSGLLEISHDSYGNDHFYAGIDYGDGKGLISINSNDNDPNYSKLELGVNGKALGVTGETNFKVANGALIELKFDQTDYENRRLNIANGHLLSLYKSNDGARNCNIGGTEGTILNAYVGTSGTNFGLCGDGTLLDPYLISAESGTNNNFNVKVKDGFDLINLDYFDGSGLNHTGKTGSYEYKLLVDGSQSQKLGSLLELTQSNNQLCKLGVNGTLLNINSNGSSVNINTNASLVTNTIILGDSYVEHLRCAAPAGVEGLSDIRDKKDITPIERGIDFINELTPVEFTWNMRDGGKVDVKGMGFIAQQLQEVQEKTNIEVPGLVVQFEEDKLGAAYAALLPLMVKSIQDLSKEIENLKEEIKVLKNK
jgi:hypothetical protein